MGALATPATALVALVPILVAAGHAAGWWRARFGLFAGFGLLAWLVSTVAQDAWRLGDTIETQIFWWQLGIFASGWVYLTVFFRLGARAAPFSFEAVLVFFLGNFVVFAIAQGVPHGAVASQKIAESILLVWVVVAAWAVWRVVPREDFLAHTLWTVLLLYEALGLALFVDCQILHELHVDRTTGSACDRKYVSPVSWLLPAVTGAAIVCLLARRWRAGSRS